MANVRVRAMVCFAMLFMAMFVSSLAVAKDGNVKQLPQGLDSRHGNQPTSLEGKDFRLHRTHAMDASGRVIDDVPAWLVDVRDAYPGNDKFDPMYDTKIPAFEGAIPNVLRGKIALYYFYGWKIVPKDWQIRYAFISVDGSDGFSLVAPAGEQQGWMDFSWFNACVGCMDEEADGLILGAHQAYKDDMQIDDMPSGEPRLLPRPWMLVRPDKCSVLFAYRPKESLPVEAAMVAVWSERNLIFVGSVYAALPSAQKSLADFIVRQYRKDRSRCVHQRL
jgi:hypothetical protein